MVCIIFRHACKIEIYSITVTLDLLFYLRKYMYSNHDQYNNLLLCSRIYLKPLNMYQEREKKKTNERLELQSNGF